MTNKNKRKMSLHKIIFNVVNFDLVDSTLNIAAHPKWHHGDLIVAQAQSNGRGQRGNQWSSDKGANLTFTLVVEPTHVAVNEQFRISMTTALAVVHALESFAIKARIKWPNDIYVDQKKICGILIEHFFTTATIDRSLLGVGINVLQQKFDPSLANPTSLALLGVTADPEQVLQRFCDAFSSLYNLDAGSLEKLYCQSLYRHEGFFPYRDAAGDFSAAIDSVDPHSGVLTLRDTANNLRRYYFKEVAFLV